MPLVSMTDVDIFNPGAPGMGGGMPLIPGVPLPGMGASPSRPSDLIIGEIREWTTLVPPASWLLCDGTLYAQAAQAQLFAVIGLTFIQGGDPAGFFRVPDCRGRVVVGAGSALPLGFHDGLAEPARNPIQHGHAGNMDYDTTALAGGIPLVLPHFWQSDTFFTVGSFWAAMGMIPVAAGDAGFNIHFHGLAGGTGTGWGGNHEAADLLHAHPAGGGLNNLANWPTYLGLNYIIYAG